MTWQHDEAGYSYSGLAWLLGVRLALLARLGAAGPVQGQCRAKWLQPSYSPSTVHTLHHCALPLQMVMPLTLPLRRSQPNSDCLSCSAPSTVLSLN